MSSYKENGTENGNYCCNLLVLVFLKNPNLVDKRIQPGVLTRQSPRVPYGGFPKLGVPFLGVPIIRIIVFWGLNWGPLILGKYHMSHGLNSLKGVI